MRYKTVIVYERRNQDFSEVKYPKDWRIEKANPRYFTYCEDNTWGVVTNQKNVQDAYLEVGAKVFAVDDNELVEILPEEEETEEQEQEVQKDEDEDEPETVETNFNLDELIGKEKEEETTEQIPEAGYENAGEPIPEGWRDLGWLEMRTLAKNYTEDKIVNKNHAIEVLEEVERQQTQE